MILKIKVCVGSEILSQKLSLYKVEKETEPSEENSAVWRRAVDARFLLQIVWWSWKVARWLRALFSLADSPGSVVSIHMVVHKHL